MSGVFSSTARAIRSAATRLTIGAIADGQVLKRVGTTIVGAAAAGGDVSGPASSTDNAVARYDLTTGKLLQNSAVTIDDSGSINIPTGQTYKVNNVVVADNAAWAEWTPNWTNITIGNAAVTARYKQIGKFIVVRIHMVAGNTTAFVAAVFTASLPVASVSYAGSATAQPLGDAYYYDAGANIYSGKVVWASTTTVSFQIENVSATYPTMASVISTVPFAWGATDEIHCTFIYEAA